MLKKMFGIIPAEPVKDLGTILQGFTKTQQELETLIEANGREHARLQSERLDIVARQEDLLIENSQASIVLANLVAYNGTPTPLNQNGQIS